MSVLTVCCWCLLTLLHLTISYYVGNSPLLGSNAVKYCESHCKSTPSSFHNLSQWIDAKNTIDNSLDTTALFSLTPPIYEPYGFDINDVIIGLYRNDSFGSSFPSNFVYIDGTPFDWGTTPDQFPWYEGEPSENLYDYCVSMPRDLDYSWFDHGCSDKQRFLCNDCTEKLSKYILVPYYYTFWDAWGWCYDKLGTGLASVHNEDDYETTKLLCQLSDGNDCFIGSSNYGASFEYFYNTDGTTFDFGTNYYKYPWFESDPNSAAGCISILTTVDPVWIDTDCFIAFLPFICNAPSEVCYQNNWKHIIGGLQWNSSGIWNDIQWTPCTMHDFIGTQTMSIVETKQWNLITEETLTIEYIYRIYDVIDDDNVAGIILFHSICDYIFIGLHISTTNNNTVYLIMYHTVNNEYMYKYNESLDFQYKYGNTYNIKIKLSYKPTPQWNINVFGINNVSVIKTYISSEEIDYKSSLKYIGVKNVNSTILAKSLFVSNTPIYNTMYTNTISYCTDSPTALPTEMPTEFEGPDVGIITVTFIHEADVNASTIAEIISVFINQLRNDTDCIESTESNYNQTQMKVSITIYFCDDADKQYTLFATLNDTKQLTTDFVTVYNNIVPDVDLHVEVDDISLNTDFVDSIYSTSFNDIIISTEMNDRNKERTNGDSFWTVMGIIIGLIVFCVIMLGIIVFIKIKKTKNEQHRDRNVKQIQFATSISHESDNDDDDTNKNDMNIVNTMDNDHDNMNDIEPGSPTYNDDNIVIGVDDHDTNNEDIMNDNINDMINDDAVVTAGDDMGLINGVNTNDGQPNNENSIKNNDDEFEIIEDETAGNSPN